MPLVSPRAAGAEVISNTDKSHWLTSTDHDDDAAVRVPGVKRGFNHPWAFLAAGIVLALLAWSLFRAPTTEVSGLVGDLGAGSAATTTTTSTTRNGGADDTVTSDDDAGARVSPDADEATIAVATLDPELARYQLLAQQSGRLLRVDLDDGTVDYHDVTGRLFGEYDGLLYFVDGSAVFSLAADDLDAEPLPVFAAASDSPGDYVAAALTENGLIHLTTGTFTAAGPNLTMTRIDLNTGSMEQAELDQYGIFGLVEVPRAGLFELTGDGFRLLTDGSVRFYGERLIVIEECEAPGRCRSYWFDRQLGAEVDRPVPEGSTGWLLGAAGRIAITYGERGRVFLDTTTGEMLPDLVSPFGDDGIIPDDLSPDDRFLVAVPSPDSGSAQIHDLVDGQSWTLGLPRAFNLSKVLLLSKPGDGR